MKALPSNAVPYKKTPTFTEKSVPAGLLKDHQTKEGTWGKIVILKGEIVYTIQSEPQEVIRLTPENFGVVEPQVLHFIKPIGEVEFYVEFHHIP